MFYMCVEQMSTELQLRSRRCNKRKLLNKYVIITTKFMLMFTGGLILGLIILEGQALNGTLKLPNKSF